jgi:PAS domain S-box-containing protein
VIGPLRVLIVEDSLDDTELVLRELRRGHDPVQFERVEDAPAMRAALQAGGWDVIISDWNMPRFSAPAALDVLRETGIDIPFIIASGSIGEAIAVEGMRAGAHDYVLKDKLARLPAAVDREIARRSEREAHRRTEAEHRKLEGRYQRILETTHEGVFIGDAEGRFTFMNRRLEEMLGYESGELLGRSIWSIVHDADLAHMRQELEARRRGIGGGGEVRVKRKDGGEMWALRSSSPVMDAEGRYDGLFAMLVDITDRKRAEEALVESEARYRRLFEAAKDGILILDPLTGRVVDVNPFMVTMTG